MMGRRMMGRHRRAGTGSNNNSLSIELEKNIHIKFS